MRNTPCANNALYVQMMSAIVLGDLTSKIFHMVLLDTFGISVIGVTFTLYYILQKQLIRDTYTCPPIYKPGI